MSATKPRSAAPPVGSRTSPEAIKKLTQAVYRIEAQKIADQCQVDLRTVNRWLSGKTPIPFAAKCLLSGDLTPFGPGWEGWRVQGRWLISPKGLMASEADLRELALFGGRRD